jgi:hypothetical protein
MIELIVNSRWADAVDNKAAYRSVIEAFWGRLTNDRALIRKAEDNYRFGIRYMRPDGTFARDASRGGSGGHYTTIHMADLIMIASLDAMAGGKLFDYEVDGRSIHTAVSYYLDFPEDPVGVNGRYAKACKDGSMGTLEAPSMAPWKVDLNRGGETLTAMRLYALFNPEHPNTARFRQILPDLDQPTATWDSHHGPMMCFLGSHGRATEVEPPSEVVAPEPLKPKRVIHSEEVISNFVADDSRADTLFFSRPEDAKKGETRVDWNIQGRGYNPATGEFSSLFIVINEPIDAKAASAIKACHGRTDFWDGEHHPLIDIWKLASKTEYEPIESDCTIDSLSGKPKFMAEFVIDNMVDIAVGMAVDGTLENIQHNGVREFLRRIAFGEGVWLVK